MMRPLQRNDDGSASVEMAIVMPLMLALLVFGVQIGVWFYAGNVAHTAARQGLDATRVVNGTEDAGESAAYQFLDQAKGGLNNPMVTVERGTEEATVTITSEVEALTSLWSPSVSVTMSAPVERLTE